MKLSWKVSVLRSFLCIFNLLFSASCFISTVWAAPSSTTSVACSSTQNGKAVINEVNTNADFVEVYLLQSVNIANWALYVDGAKIKTLGAGNCTVNGTTTMDNSGGITTFPAGTFIYCSYNMKPSNNEVLLVDKSGALSSGDTTVIDYLSYGTPTPSAKWSVPGACGTVYPSHSASNQDVARLPDGAGSLVDNGDDSTQGVSNIGISSLSKTINNAAPTVGQNIVFTIAATAASTVTNISVNDLLPAGLTYVSSTPSTGTYTAATGIWNIGTLSAGATATLNITATQIQSGAVTNIATLYKNSTNTGIMSSVVSTASASATANPANFNCIDSGANPTTGHLYTKIAGSPLSFDVAALKADGSIETGFVNGASKNVTVELVDGSGSTACAGQLVVSQTLSFSATDQGRKAIAPITLGNAYPNLRCRVTDANQSPSIVGCSTDNFAVRPSGFTVTSSLNADASGLNNSSAPALKTGGLFALTAASGVAGYNNAPSLDASKVSAHIGSVQIGTLTGGFGNADPTTGTATGSAFSYSEVGYFNLAANGIYDDSFTAVDSAVSDCTADFSNTADSSGKIGCKFGNTAMTSYFGRFIPDHFALTPGSAIPACNSSFTYFGQDGFSTLFTLIAQNSGNITTQNYQGGFARLGLTVWNVFNFSSTGLPTGSLLSASATSPVGVWSQGIADVTAKHQLSRPTALSVETSIVVQSAPLDLDGVTMASTSVAAGTPLRYGRLFLQNAHGSELIDLPVSLTVQYWNGSAFVLNTHDSCTTVSTPASGSGLTFYPEVATSTQGNHLSATETAATVSVTNKLVAGDAQLKFSAPGSANDGYLDLVIQAQNWLKFDWNSATAGDESPASRATFGIYKGDDSQIYLREVY